MKLPVRILLFSGLMLMPLTGLAQESAGRLGCLSPQRAFAESAVGKAGIARLAALEDKQAKEIATRNQTLRSQEQALEQNGAILNPDARARQTREVERFRIDVQRFIQEAQAELVSTQHEIESAFLAKLRPAVERVAKAKQLQLVVNVDADSVVWSNPALDITAEVVKELAVPEPPRHP